MSPWYVAKSFVGPATLQAADGVEVPLKGGKFSRTVPHFGEMNRRFRAKTRRLGYLGNNALHLSSFYTAEMFDVRQSGEYVLSIAPVLFYSPDWKHVKTAEMPRLELKVKVELDKWARVVVWLKNIFRVSRRDTTQIGAYILILALVILWGYYRKRRHESRAPFQGG